MGTLLITGGAGFIGANLVHHAAGRTRRRPSRRRRQDDLRGQSADGRDWSGNEPASRSCSADIADRRGDASRLFRRTGPSAILNLAAETHVDRSIDSPGAFIETNVTGTFVLLEVARRYVATLERRRAEAFRFLHVSTDEVYGSLGADGRFAETTAYAPNSPYAASKAAADHLVRAYFHTYGLPTLITNCSNNYGPFQHPEKLIPLTILNALEGRPLPIYGDGGNVRDWLHVEDHCAGS